MRVLTVSRLASDRILVPLEPDLVRRGVMFRHLTLQEFGAEGGRGFAGKVERYLSPAAAKGIATAVAEFRPDLVHVTAGRALALAVVRALRADANLQIVLDHGAIGGLNPLNPFDWATYFNRRIAKLVVPSRALLNNWMGRPLLGRCIGPDRCWVLPHPIEPLPTLSDAGRASLRAGLGFGADEIVVGSVCRIRPIKNLSFVAGIVRALGPPFTFAVVGSGDERETRRLRRAGGDRLKLLGPIPDARSMMAAFDVYVTPTRLPGESFGLAPGEAMANGVPVLTMNFGGTAEIVEHGVSGLALGDDAREWSRALVRLADRDLRRAMGAAARARIASRFAPEMIAAECFGLYETVLAGKRPGR